MVFQISRFQIVNACLSFCQIDLKFVSDLQDEESTIISFSVHVPISPCARLLFSSPPSTVFIRFVCNSVCCCIQNFPLSTRRSIFTAKLLSVLARNLFQSLGSLYTASSINARFPFKFSVSIFTAKLLFDSVQFWHTSLFALQVFDAANTFKFI